MFHVATRFAHVNFVPLIPLEGWGALLTAGVLSLAAFFPEEGLDQLRVSFGLPVAARARAGWPPEGEAR